jgi:hypothetical protein
MDNVQTCSLILIYVVKVIVSDDSDFDSMKETPRMNLQDYYQ